MILHTSYFPPIDDFAALLHEDTLIEAHETFQKRSSRNRCEIMTASGVQTLSVPIIGGRGVRLPIREVRVDHTENFASQHLKAIHTAYRSSPYYEHFIDKIEPLFSLNEKFLFDLNCRITEELLAIMKCPRALTFTTEFVGASASVPTYTSNEYYQVFSDRQPFVNNLSILDWLFCNSYRGFLKTDPNEY